ncbi:MAG: hypothetical protein FWH51_00065 [Dehalococcoidia bacterium]|nr:hypothetical protein [Dehalococcoidia bacterium]
MAEFSIQKIIVRFQAALASHENWYLALLGAIREWSVAEEETDGACYRYLIAGEALDLAQISERLLKASHNLIPEQEKYDLLFRGHPPIALTPEELRELLGEEKYKQHLNFFYGITVEEALQEVTAEEVRKEERGVRVRTDAWITGEVFLRIYGKTQPELTGYFRAEKDSVTNSVSLVEMKEFSYWLFKFRLAHSDPEKSASDTKKALGWLKGQGEYVSKHLPAATLSK